MSEEWYEGLPEDAFGSDNERLYKEALFIVKKGLSEGLDFNAACAALIVEDDDFRKSLIDDLLKAVIAEEHFAADSPLDEIGRKLNVPIERLEKALAEMFEDIENTAISEFHKGSSAGNA